MVTTITLERLRKRGYESILDHYFKVSPQLNEPLYPPWRDVQWCERRTSSPTRGEAVYSIVRSAVRFLRNSRYQFFLPRNCSLLSHLDYNQSYTEPIDLRRLTQFLSHFSEHNLSLPL